MHQSTSDLSSSPYLTSCSLSFPSAPLSPSMLCSFLFSSIYLIWSSPTAFNTLFLQHQSLFWDSVPSSNSLHTISAWMSDRLCTLNMSKQNSCFLHPVSIYCSPSLNQRCKWQHYPLPLAKFAIVLGSFLPFTLLTQSISKICLLLKYKAWPYLLCYNCSRVFVPSLSPGLPTGLFPLSLAVGSLHSSQGDLFKSEPVTNHLKISWWNSAS